MVDRLTSATGPKDALLLKIIRNISQWSFNQQQEFDAPDLLYRYRGLWSPHIKAFIRIIQESDSHDIVVEVLGILANMTSLDLPANQTWTKLLREQNLLNLLSKLLVPGMCQNDLLLEVVLLISTAASDSSVCELLTTSNIIGLLYQLWQERAEHDAELHLQLIVCFHKLFLHDTSREEAMYSTRIVSDLIESLGHRNAQVRKAADQVLEIVLELDRQPTGQLGKLGMQIRKKRFESYNQAWLQETDMLHVITINYTTSQLSALTTYISSVLFSYSHLHLYTARCHFSTRMVTRTI